MENYNLNTLNEEQRNALFTTEGVVLVTAGAGSGKTRLLTHRIAYLIEEKNISPYNILAITFTNKATNEMKERISNMGGKDVWISTFHSMCVKILRRDIERLEGYTRNFSIYSESDREKVLKDIFAEKNVTDEKIKKEVTYFISNWKNTNFDLNTYFVSCENNRGFIDGKLLYSLATRYEEYLKKNNALDFDDLLKKTYELFLNDEEILYQYSNRFRYILVDEFQDTNSIQYELVKMLCKVHGNLFVVGDEDQCIYSWRGANFQNIFKIKDDFENVHVFKLERNYRSSKNILNIANNVIKNNRERLDKKLWTDKEEGEAPVVYNAYDERDEALFVANKIQELVAKGYSYSDFAILMRMNALSRSFEESFLSYNIPHKLFGGFKFYERVEIKNILYYLRLFINKRDDVSFTKIINFPKRGIGDGAIAKLQIFESENVKEDDCLLDKILSEDIKQESAIYKKLEKFRDTFIELKENFDSYSLSEFIKKVISKFDIMSAFPNKNEEDENKLMNINSFIVSVEEYEKDNPEATLQDYLETVTLISDVDSIGEDGFVSLATVHAAKGLEFKVVFVVGLEEQIFPSNRKSGNSELEEERRLMYVAITRAEERIFLTYCSKRYMYGQTNYQMQSRFIKELGLVFKDKIDKKDDFFIENKKTFDYFNKNIFLKEEKEDKSRIDVTKYKIGQIVKHPKYGEGKIIDISDDGLVGDIVFEGFGKKSLMLDLAPLEILEG